MIPSSELNKRITILKEVYAKNSLGSQTVQYVELCTCWAKVYFRNGGVNYEENYESPFITAEFTIRKRDYISTNCIVVYQNNHYEIENVDNLNNNGDLRLMTKAVKLAKDNFVPDASYYIPAATSHNTLGNLQGGKESEYYHLDASLYEYVQNIDVIDGSLKIGSTSDYTEFGTDGTMRFHGEATNYDDLVVPLTTSKLGINSKPDFDFNQMAYMFPQNDTSEILYFIVQLPHKYAEGTTLYPHVHYKQQNANQLPTYKLEYKIANVGDSMPTTWNTYVMDSSAVAWVDSNTHQIADGEGGIDASTYKISALLLCKLYRDDNNVSGDVPTWQFDIHYQVDALGSNELYIK